MIDLNKFNQVRLFSIKDNLHYLNWSDNIGGRITGMTRYACFWVENGEIKEAGNHKELIKQNKLYKKLYDLQFEVENE